MPTDYVAIIRVSEKELDEMVMADKETVTGFPSFYCVCRNGSVKFWPRISDDTQLMAACWLTPGPAPSAA